MEYLLQFLNGTTEEQNIVLLSFILTAFLLGLFLAWAARKMLRPVKPAAKRAPKAAKVSPQRVEVQ